MEGYCIKNLQIKAAEVEEAVKYNLRHIATKNLDQEWNKINSVPFCPHCRAGLLPDDSKKNQKCPNR